MSLAVTHTSHGFDSNDIGKAVRSSGTDGQFVVARANTAANAEVVGVITSIDTANQYTITTSGFVDVVAAVPTATAGTVYFLAEAADSQLTSTEPTTAGAVSKPVAVVTESDAKMLLIHYRGEVITSAVVANAPNDANYLIGTANSGLSAEIVVGTAPGGELGGTWASPTVDSTHSNSAHHAEAHTVASHSDTTATGAELETLTDGSTTALHVHTIADDSIVEAKLDVSNGPTNGQFLQAQSGEGGGLTWAAATTTAPVFARVLRTSSTPTTTSSSLVDLTGATVTITTGAYPVAYSFACNVRISTAGRVTLNVDLDGSLQLGTAGIGTYITQADDVTIMSFSGMTAALSAGSHTLKVKWKTGAGTATLDSDSGAHYLWAVHEIR
jgi:hypothetical protein